MWAKNIIHIGLFRKADTRTIYNAIYQDGKGGTFYMKRFAVTGVTRDREYNLTAGTPGSRVAYFTANPNGEAEVVRVTLKPKPRLKTLQFDIDFAEMAIKGRTTRGNIVTRNEVHRFTLKERGRSTLGGRQVWFDPDILRLNYDGRGDYLGEFGPSDLVLVILTNGEYYTSTFDAANHYEDNILRIERFVPEKVWSAVVFDADQGYPYLKRFTFEPRPASSASPAKTPTAHSSCSPTLPAHAIAWTSPCPRALRSDASLFRWWPPNLSPSSRSEPRASASPTSLRQYRGDRAYRDHRQSRLRLRGGDSCH